MSWMSFLHNTSGDAILDQKNEHWVSYPELYQQTCAWVDYLKDNKIGPGDRVAYLAQNSLEHLLLLFACAKIGAIFVPLNFRAPDEENSRLLKRVEPKIFFSDIPNVEMKNEYDFHEVNEDLPHLMLFTSGSTGSPKGVLLSGKMLRANQLGTVENWGLKSDDISVIETPFFHTGAFNVLCLPLLSIGAKVVLAPKFSVDNFFEISQILTVYFGVPTMFEMIQSDERFSNLAASPLRFLISGGAPCSFKLIKSYQALGLNFKQGYGLTEVGPNCFLLDEEFSVSKVGSIGKPMPHSEVLLINEKGEVVTKVGQVGEIVLKGDHLCSGFYGDPEKFESCLINGFYKTGDLAYFDEDGFYFIKGRKKEMYISGGENVYPREVEELLNSFEEIESTQIVAVPDEKWGEVGFAFLRMRNELSKEDIENRLKTNLAKYKHPKYMDFIDDFPLLANGKIDKKALQSKAIRSLNAI